MTAETAFGAASDPVGLPQHRRCLVGLGGVSRVQHRQRPIGADRRSLAGERGEADGVVDPVFRQPPAAAERDDGEADRAGVDRR